MGKTYRVAVVGATGLVGREMLAVLEERGFPTDEPVLLASPRSAGTELHFRGQHLKAKLTTPEAVAGAQIVLMSAGAQVSRELAPSFAETGAVVIDNSSAWRDDPEIPLIVPEVNAERIADYAGRRIIANPNCSTIQMVVALAPLHQKAGLKRVVVSTYQAVSGKGRRAMDELSSQVTKLFTQEEIHPEVFPRRIAFNCLPQVEAFEEDGFTKEEHKMVNETRKILPIPDLPVCATCVRVPVFNCHAESVVAEFENRITAEEAREILRTAPGVMVMDDPPEGMYPTQVEAEGTDATLVGRIREDPSVPNTLVFWCVADNLRKGAATNAVQIAEILVRDHLS